MHLPFVVGVSPTLHIRGLIAIDDIKKGAVVESCPVIFIHIKKEEEFLKQTVLWKYYFEWTKKHHIFALGYGSLYNLSYTPNVRYLFNFKEQRLVFRAIRNIQKGDEIMINYNWDPDNKDPIEEHLIDFNAHFDTQYTTLQPVKRN